MEIVRAIAKAFLVIFKYVAMSAILFLGSLSVFTAKFPPPITEFYKNLSAAREALSSSPSLADAVQSQKARAQMLSQFTNENGEMAEKPATNILSCQTEVESLRAEKRSNQIEIAHLKSELARTQVILNEVLSKR